MGVSISHSFCPQGSEGDSMRQTVLLVLLGLSCVLCVPEASPNPDANADPHAHWGSWGYGGLGAYEYGGLNGGLYRGYGGYGWGRKKRNADALPSADPSADPAANAHWGSWGYGGLGTYGYGGLGAYGYGGLYGGLYRGYGGYGWGRKKREAEAVPSADPSADPAADADAHWGSWGYGRLGNYGYGGLGAYGYGGLGAYGYGGLNGGLYRGYGGYGWGRKKREAEAVSSADPSA